MGISDKVDKRKYILLARRSKYVILVFADKWVPTVDEVFKFGLVAVLSHVLYT